MRKAEAKEFYVAGTVWNIWADYWTPITDPVPPLSYFKMGGGEDYIFVSAVSEQDLDGFIQAVKATPDLKFFKQGKWWLKPHRWYGTWSVFSAEIRQGFFGIDRRIFASEEVLDFDGSGDTRMTPLRSDKRTPPGAVEPGDNA
ncbi:hypothetical protein [Rhodoluna sp. KAS3]|uniref:hypothetical protein n=1 Tax=Rhodoluna sp. KAS3 TaxID=942880 RepID=UPI002232B286|nr:hypothetical protein [Rhodoluna sp. KAS3]BDS49494.1 hypothetical protein RKAS3_10710 [Rhodoluna sp. KAS3]